MKKLTSVLLILVALTLHAQRKLTFIATKSKVQGEWSCISSLYDDPNIEHDAIGPWYMPGPDVILFENDSVFEFNYPCELVARNGFIIQNDTLNADTRIEFEGDTLVLKTGKVNFRTTERRFVKTTLDSAIISRLKNYELNVICLYGIWRLETSYDSGYDGNGIVNYDFPFKPQRTIVFSSNARFDYSTRILWLSADGVIKPFSVVRLSSDGNALEVQTMNWYQGARPYVLTYHKAD